MGGTSIEKSGRGMSEVPLRHEIVSLDDTVNVPAVNTDSNTHDHVLRTFSNPTIEAEKVRTFKSLETETRQEKLEHECDEKHSDTH